MKKDEVDAVRAERETMGRLKLAAPRAAGQRVALANLMATRASAVEAAKQAHAQLQCLLVSSRDSLWSPYGGPKGRNHPDMSAPSCHHVALVPRRGHNCLPQEAPVGW